MEKPAGEAHEAVENVVIRKQQMSCLYACLDALTPEERKIIEALFLSCPQVSESKLSKTLAIPRTTLQSRKYSILGKLRKMMAKMGHGSPDL